MKRLLFAFAMLVLPLTLSAQTVVEGTVHDASDRPVANASVTVQRPDGPTLVTTSTTPEGKFRINTLDAGAYQLQVQAPNFFPFRYEFVLRARQPLSVKLQLQPKETVKQSVEVQSGYLTIDPEKTGSSYTFTHQDLENVPDPIVETTNDLVNNLMPGASDGHDNFLLFVALNSRFMNSSMVSRSSITHSPNFPQGSARRSLKPST